LLPNPFWNRVTDARKTGCEGVFVRSAIFDEKGHEVLLRNLPAGFQVQAGRSSVSSDTLTVVTMVSIQS